MSGGLQSELMSVDGRLAVERYKVGNALGYFEIIGPFWQLLVLERYFSSTQKNYVGDCMTEWWN